MVRARTAARIFGFHPRGFRAERIRAVARPRLTKFREPLNNTSNNNKKIVYFIQKKNFLPLRKKKIKFGSREHLLFNTFLYFVEIFHLLKFIPISLHFPINIIIMITNCHVYIHSILPTQPIFTSI